MLELRQLEINELFRAVHDAKEVLKALSEDEQMLRQEVLELEAAVLEHDAASAAQVARAEEIAQALSTAGNKAELNRLENDLNKCIEHAELSSRELSTVKGKATTKLREADAKASALRRKSQETEAVGECTQATPTTTRFPGMLLRDSFLPFTEVDAAARAKELPVIVAAMEATAHGLQDAEGELGSKTGAIEAVEAEIRQRIEANTEAIKFTRNMKAVTEKKVTMEARNRSRMNVRVKPDENLAAAMAAVKTTPSRGGGGGGGGGAMGGAAKPRARTPNGAGSRSPFRGGRTRPAPAPAKDAEAKR